MSYKKNVIEYFDYYSIRLSDTYNKIDIFKKNKSKLYNVQKINNTAHCALIDYVGSKALCFFWNVFSST